MAPVRRLRTGLVSLLVCYLKYDIFAVSVVGLRSSSPIPQQRATHGPAVATSGQWMFRQLNAAAAGSSGVRLRHHEAASFQSGNTSVSECVLLFGAYCNGNLGDVIQPAAMEHLLAYVAPGQCFWYAHPWDEDIGKGNRIGEFFSDNISGGVSQLIHLTPDHAEEVNRFKALVIGGGGLFVARHAPLYVKSFAEALTLPVVVLGVGASSVTTKRHATLLRKAVFLSGRDATSTKALANMLRLGESVVKPDDVALVRDPVLSDKFFTDREGSCWRQSEAEPERPLCFVLPASKTEASKEMHRQLLAQVVRPGDVFVNVFPKHQQEVLEQHNYPGEILQILDPAEFTDRMCSCRAIISTRLHGVVLGLHMGVPTFGAFSVSHGHKVPEVVIDTMRLPDQYLLIDEKLTRGVVDEEVGVVRDLYVSHGRRESIHARLSELNNEFEAQARHVLFDVIGVQQGQQQQQQPNQEQLATEKTEVEEKPTTAAAMFEGPAAAKADRASPRADAKNRIRERREHRKRLRSAREPVERQRSRAAEATSTGPTQGIERPEETVPAHSTAETKAVALRLRTSPENMLHQLPAAATSGTVAATTPVTTVVSLHNEPADISETAADEVESRTALTDALLAYREVLRQPIEEVEQQPPTEAPPAVITSARVSSGEVGPVVASDATVAKTLLPNDGTVKNDPITGEAAVNPVGNDHRVTEGTERVNAVTKTSGSRTSGAAGNNVPMPVAGEGAPLNDAVVSVLINGDFLVTIFFVAVILGLALIPPGGAACRPPREKLGLEDAAGDGGDGMEGDCRTSGDSELGAAPSSTLRGRSASADAGVAATSSKMVFVLNFVMWVSLAMGFSGYGKAYLRDTRDPIGLLVLQGATGVVVLCVLARFGVLDLHPGKDLTPAAARQAGLASILHTGQALLTNFAVLVGGVAVTNALKAMEPVAAAAFSYFLLGKTCSGPRMAALATIVTGILIMTFKGNNAGGGGGGGGKLLLSAVFTMAAVCCNALRNVVIKRGKPVPPHQTLLTCSAAATVVGVALMLLRLVFRNMDDILQRGGSGHGGGDGDDLASSWLQMHGVNAALCFVGYNLASFNLLLRLSPIGHAVGNSCKRMVVFASGLLLLGEVMSVRQLGGTAVALSGVLAYNVAGTR